MNKAFVDTTILTDVLLKEGEKKKSAQKSLQSFDQTELPVFAIKEFKAGPLKNFVWIHNKLSLTKSFSQTIAAIKRIAGSPRKYMTSTALEALESATYKDKFKKVEDLKNRYGSAASIDSFLAERYRLAIKTRIFQAWNKRRKVTTHIVNELVCYSELAPFEKDKMLKLDPVKCSYTKECCLADEYRSRINQLVKLREKLKNLDKKPEYDRQIKILKEMIRKNILVDDRMCSGLGDIYFCIFCPRESKILTTNIKDHQPLADILGKVAISPQAIIIDDNEK